MSLLSEESKVTLFCEKNGIFIFFNSLLIASQLQWASTNNYYSDLNLRLLAALILASTLNLFYERILGKHIKGSSHLKAISSSLCVSLLLIAFHETLSQILSVVTLGLLIYTTRRSSSRNSYSCIIYSFCIVLSYILYQYSILFDFSGARLLLSIIPTLLFFKKFLFEFFLITCLGLVLIAYQKWSRNLFLILCFVFFEIYSLQYISLFLSSNYITRDAISNTGDIDLLISPFSIFVISLPFILLFVLKTILKSTPYTLTPDKKPVFAIAAVFFSLTALSLSNGESARIAEIWSDENIVSNDSPIYSLSYLLKSKPKLDENISLDKKELDLAKKFNIRNIRLNQKYPLMKNFFYKSPLPFKSASPEKKMNVIAIFVDALSTRKLGVYGSHHKEISPNIDRFSKKAMVVDKYFNHTAATYRGLRGQFCSMYPYFGGLGGWADSLKKMPEMRVFCLPHLLNQEGYQTIFMGNSIPEKAKMKDLVQSLGFKKTFFKNSIQNDFLNKEPVLHDYLSDHQMMRGLTSFLEKKDTEQPPFFLSLYTTGTHANLDIEKNGIPYKDGKNNVLNTAYNFDDAFGGFWDYFLKSSFKENTIVILTADHPHFPSQNWIKVAGDNYQRIFYDKIAFLIYHPTLKLPKRYNANTTSLDFAPSIAHLMGVPNQKTPFLGSSFFSKQLKKHIGFGSFGDNVAIFGENRISEYHRDNPNYSNEVITLFKLIDYLQMLELNNRIWPSSVPE